MAIFFQSLGQHGIPMHSGHNHCMLQTKTSLVPSLCLVHRCACLNSQYSPVTRCKNFDRGKISPLFLTAKFSPRNYPLPKSPPPLYTHMRCGATAPPSPALHSAKHSIMIPDATFQIRSVESSPPETTILPFVDTATLQTGPSCPANVSTSAPVIKMRLHTIRPKRSRALQTDKSNIQILTVPTGCQEVPTFFCFSNLVPVPQLPPNHPACTAQHPKTGWTLCLHFMEETCSTTTTECAFSRLSLLPGGCYTKLHLRVNVSQMKAHDLRNNHVRM